MVNMSSYKHWLRAEVTDSFASLAINAFSYEVLNTIEDMTVLTMFIKVGSFCLFDVISAFLKSSVVNIKAFFEMPDLRFSTDSLMKLSLPLMCYTKTPGWNLFIVLK